MHRAFATRLVTSGTATAVRPRTPIADAGRKGGAATPAGCAANTWADDAVDARTAMGRA